MSEQDVTDVKAALATIRAKMPFLISLTDAERKEMPKMGDKSTGFHDKVQGYMESNPEFIPGYLKPEETAKDAALRAQLMQLIPDLKTLARQGEDTFIEVNSELWQGDLGYYNNVRQGAHQGAGNAQPIYNDLKGRFPGRAGGSGKAPSKP